MCDFRWILVPIVTIGLAVISGTAFAYDGPIAAAVSFCAMWSLIGLQYWLILFPVLDRPFRAFPRVVLAWLPGLIFESVRDWTQA